MVINLIIYYQTFQLSAPAGIQMFSSVVMMLSFNVTREAIHYQSCPLAARLDTEIMLPISLMLVLFQPEMPCHIQSTENGVHVSQNCFDLKWTDTPFQPKTQPFRSSNATLSMCMHLPPLFHLVLMLSITARQSSPRKGRKSNLTNSMYTTCSGCISKPATRLITQM